MGIPALARGSATVVRTPTKSWSRGPSTRNALHRPPSAIPAGTKPSSQMIESSSGERLTLHHSPATAQPGMGSSGGRRHTTRSAPTASSRCPVRSRARGLSTDQVSRGRSEARVDLGSESFPARPFDTLAQPLTIEWSHGAVAQRERASLAWKRSRVRFPPAPHDVTHYEPVAG